MAAEEAIPSCIGDPHKCDSMWKQGIATELHTFQSVYQPMEELQRRRATRGLLAEVRPHSAPVGDVRKAITDWGRHLDPEVASNIRPGTPVQIQGMNRRRDLNGASGEVTEAKPDEDGRVCVRLRSRRGADKKVRVRAERLALMELPQLNDVLGHMDASQANFLKRHSRPSQNGNLWLCGPAERFMRDVPHGRRHAMARELTEVLRGARASSLPPGARAPMGSAQAFSRNLNGNFFPVKAAKRPL